MEKKNRNILVGAASLIIILIATVFFIKLVPCPASATGFVMGFCEAPSDSNTEGINFNTKDPNTEGIDTISYEETLAKCLTEKGVKMYGAYWCGHCKNQKEMFGDAFQYVDYIECTETPGLCDSAGVSGYPTWVGPDGSKYPGEKSLNELANMFGC